MKTARLTTTSFYIQCPHCEEAQIEPRTGSEMFTAEDVTPGQIMNCSVEDCGKPFRLPTSLKASAEREAKVVQLSREE